jgi:hypothetical protein
LPAGSFSTNAPVRLKVFDSGTALEAADAFSAGKVDLAVVRGDVGDPVTSASRRRAMDGEHPFCSGIGGGIMIRNGLYLSTLKMVLKKMESAEGVSRGVLVLRNGKMLGGGPYFYTIGSYTCSGSKWRGEATTQEHTTALATRLWAREIVTIGFSGTYNDEGAEIYATAFFGKQSMQYHGIFRLLKALDD